MSDAVKKTPVVELQNVGVQYPSGVTALEGITLEVFEKDLIGLIGPNGSGKSTLLKVILGLIKPNVGTVKLFGEPISEKNLKKVGFVPQRTQVEDANFPSTVYETVLLGRIPKVGLFRRYGRKDYEKVDELLNLIGIHDLRDRKIGQLSGGQSQRVFLAKALVGEPKLLILDEPTSGVDVDSKREFYNIIGKLDREQGTTIILASHEIGIVTKLATRIVCINKSQFYCGEITDVEASSLLSNWLKGGLLHDHP